jgi:hypothetical protein
MIPHFGDFGHWDLADELSSQHSGLKSCGWGQIDSTQGQWYTEPEKMCYQIRRSEAFEGPDMATLEIPPFLHADLESLAADGQTEPSEVIARVVEVVRQKHKADSPTRVV